MEKDRESRVIAIVALLVAVVGLSIGFAAFTKDLNITFSESNVNVSGDLDIRLLASDDVNDTSTIVDGELGIEGVFIASSVNPATISSDSTTIGGLGATFSDKDQVAVYHFYVHNNSEYDVYLKSVDFLNYTNFDTNKVCTALEGTVQSLVDEACKDIHILIEFAGESILDTSTNGFESSKIQKGEVMPIHIGIIYAGKVINDDFEISSNALLPNGDFKINFGDIKFSYSSLEG